LNQKQPYSKKYLMYLKGHKNQKAATFDRGGGGDISLSPYAPYEADCFLVATHHEHGRK
jgi:hypothetical protein